MDLSKIMTFEGYWLTNKRIARACSLSKLGNPINTSAILAELVSLHSYFKSKGELDSDGMFTRSVDKIEESIYLSQHVQSKCIKNLSAFGLVYSDNKALNKRRRFKVQEEEILAFLRQSFEDEEGEVNFYKSKILISRNQKNSFLDIKKFNDSCNNKEVIVNNTNSSSSTDSATATSIELSPKVKSPNSGLSKVVQFMLETGDKKIDASTFMIHLDSYMKLKRRKKPYETSYVISNYYLTQKALSGQIAGDVPKIMSQAKKLSGIILNSLNQKATLSGGRSNPITQSEILHTYELLVKHPPEWIKKDKAADWIPTPGQLLSNYAAYVDNVRRIYASTKSVDKIKDELQSFDDYLDNLGK